MVEMQSDPRDVWPDDVSIGTFHIEDGTVQKHPGATAHILFVCPNGVRCAILLGPTHVPRETPEHLPVWAWDGNRERPTITPSINCLKTVDEDGIATGGCGWHGFITAGEMR